MVTQAQAKLLEWFGDEYSRRTALIEAGEGRIDWLAPGYRVSWSEVLAKAEELGIDMNPIDLRIWFDQQRRA